jgi:glycosyltransferase involved in cell wall biosynthesis
LLLAKAAINQGFDVHLITNLNEEVSLIEKHGITVHTLNVSRGSSSVFRSTAALFHLLQLLKKLNPDILHNIAIKPILLGSLAAFLVGIPKCVNTLAGLGSSYGNSGLLQRLRRLIVLSVLRLAQRLKNTCFIYQNEEDREIIAGRNWKQFDSRLIKGSGVELREFPYFPEKTTTKTILFASRLIWEKGVGDFIEAARYLRDWGVPATFQLAGKIDEDNPQGVDLEVIECWEQEGLIDWKGYVRDMPKLIRGCNLVCLPTFYREGVPKILIEAAASGRAIIATDWVGCREIVKDEVNGLLVPINNPLQLARTIKVLLQDDERRRAMGLAGRSLVAEEFSIGIINKATLDLY